MECTSAGGRESRWEYLMANSTAGVLDIMSEVSMAAVLVAAMVDLLVEM